MRTKIFTSSIIIFILINTVFFSIEISSVLAAANISSCQTLSAAGIYILTQNVSSSGTCFSITGSNIILDLNWKTVTFGSSGAGVMLSGANNVVKNGYITGGTGVNVAGVAVRGSGNEAAYLSIHINGGNITGEQYINSINLESSNSKVHHIYGEVHGSTSNISYAADNIWYSARGGGGSSIHDSILVGGHRGINADKVGDEATNPPTSYIYNNYVQHVRTPGCKQPNGIGVTQAQNFEVYNNQIISDDGRGFITSAYGNGNPIGAKNVKFYNNRVDVGYVVPASGGQYVENHVAGTYSRYSSFDCLYENNIIIVDNKAGDATECVFTGSDSADNQGNNTYNNNICVNHDTGSTDATMFRVAWNSSLYANNNKYMAPKFFIGNYDYNNVPPTGTGNVVLAANAYTPNAPAGLKITKYFNSYLLTWNDNRTAYASESQTYEYFVYKDGQRIKHSYGDYEQSSRGGTFYVDIDVTGTHTYQIAAVNLAGTEGAKSASVSTANAANGWEGGSTTPPPTTKSGDLNSDSKVDIMDLGIFLSNWGATTKPASDINQDGKVDIIDLGILLSNWG